MQQTTLLRACLDRFAHLVPSWLRPEGSEDPGCTRGLPGVGCSARSNLYDELERLVATGAQSAHLIRELCERVWSGEVSREQAVPARCAPHGPPMGPACGNPHGYAGLLPWGWLKFTGPERVQPQETAIEQPGPLARVDDLPKGSSSSLRSTPSPTPSVNRPRLRWSSVTVSRASLWTRRRESGVTIVPSRSCSVAQAMAASGEGGALGVVERYGVRACSRSRQRSS
jgi:hypothetical protein